MNTSGTNPQSIPDQLAIAAWQKILVGVRDLEGVYEDYPELNDTQPAAAEVCIPMSLDEWATEIEELINQLKSRR
jgi:hypothetical protein